MRRHPFAVLAALPLLLAGQAASAGPQEGKPSPEAIKAHKAVEEFLVEYKAADATIAVISDCSALPKIFPERQFVAVHFREWPVAKAAPKPLTSRNVFVVGKDGKPLLLTDAQGLEKYFKENAPPLTSGERLEAAVDAWLRLSQEFVQDGYYKFQFDRNSRIGLKELMESGVLNVVPEMGNKGHLKVEVWYDERGKVSKIVEENKVVRGMRPRCQATRLLDPDPLIREICEQDLLVMGRAAQGYLMEQRATASPELRRAIDRVWQKILDEGR